MAIFFKTEMHRSLHASFLQKIITNLPTSRFAILLSSRCLALLLLCSCAVGMAPVRAEEPVPAGLKAVVVAIDRLHRDHLVARTEEELKTIAIKALLGTAGQEPGSGQASLLSAWQLARQARPGLSEAELRGIALHALMASYQDRRNRYLDEATFKEMRGGSVQEDGGTGVTLREKDNMVQVLWTAPGSPARRIGLPAYSQLLKIDDVPIAGKSLAEVRAMLRGPLGSDVDVQLRLQTGEIRSWLFEREAFTATSLEARLLPGQVVYLRLYNLGSQVAARASETLRKLSGFGPLTGVILDLRQNPGGLLSEAIAVTDLFLAEGTIICLQTRTVQGNCFSANAAQLQTGKLVVLVDESTASGAEIIAAVLQHRRAARVVGHRTYGYANVQVVLPLSPQDKGALLMTTTQIVPDGGVSFQDKGVIPDICMDSQHAKSRTGSVKGLQHSRCQRAEGRVLDGEMDPDIDMALRVILE